MIYTLVTIDGRQMTFHLDNLVAVILPSLITAPDQVPAAPVADVILHGVMTKCNLAEAMALDKVYREYWQRRTNATVDGNPTGMVNPPQPAM